MQHYKLGISLILIHWLLLGCQNGFDARGINSLSSPSVTNPGGGLDNGGGIGGGGVVGSTNCFDDTSVNACLIFKNQVEAVGGPIVDYVNFTSDLTEYQTFGVNINGMDNSGYLQNSNVRVNISDGQRVRVKTDGTWKYEYKDNDSSKALAQTTSYYMINRTIDYLTERGGNPTQGLRIDVDALDMSVENNAYFNTVSESIRIGYASFEDNQGNTVFEQELALSTEVIIHEYGHAAMQRSSNGATRYGNTNLNVPCVSGGTDYCCSTANGCSFAIDEGAADVLAVFMYPDSPSVGNVFSNDDRGLTVFGVSRNMELSADLTAQQAYQAAQDYNPQYSSYNGQIHNMGVVYSTAWRLAWLSAKDAGLEREIEEIFLEHLSSMTGDDTFSTALDKILQVDQTFYASRHRQRFLDAFAAKGISPATP